MKRIYILMALALMATASFAKNYPYQKIKDVKINDSRGVLTTRGDSVTIIGIVQSPNFYVNSIGGTRPLMFSVYDSTGEIMVSVGSASARNFYNAKKGDMVMLQGKMQQFAFNYAKNPDSTGLTIINITDSIKVLNSGNSQHKPTKVTNINEPTEDDLLKVDSVSLKRTSDWKIGMATNGNNGYALMKVYRVNNPADSFSLRVSNNIIVTMSAPTGIFNLKGIQFQYKRRAPYFGEYTLMPRDTGDITILTSKPIPNHWISEINKVNKASGVADSNNLVCVIKGLVQSTNLLAKGAKNIQFSLYDKTGSITILHPTSNLGYMPTNGDSLRVVGTVKQFAGLIYFQPDTINIFTGTGIVHTPQVVSQFYDSAESALVKLMAVTLQTPAQWDTTSMTKQPKQQFVVTVQNAAGNTFTVLILRQDSSLFFKPKPAGWFNLTGILAQNDNNAPFFQGYYLYPRDHNDLQPIKVMPLLVPISTIRPNNPAGIPYGALTKTQVQLKGIVYSPNFSLTNGGLAFSIEDKTGAIILASNTNPTGYKPTLGDSVHTWGTLAFSNGLELLAIDTVIVISSGNKMLKANTINSMVESDEAYHRMLAAVKLKNPAQWDSTGHYAAGGYMVTVQDTATLDTFPVWISRATNLYGSAVPKSAINITGIVSQIDYTSPFDAGYFLAPRGDYDIQQLGSLAINETASDLKLKVWPNPVNDQLNISVNQFVQGGAVLNIYNATGQNITSISYSTMTPDHSIKMSTSSLSQGVYFAKLISNAGTQTFQFIK